MGFTMRQKKRQKKATVYRVEITDKHGAGEACDALRGPVGIANRRENRACGGADGKQLQKKAAEKGTSLII
jgi:hypothetical protein